MTEYIEREVFLECQRHLYCDNCARRKNGKGKFVYEIGDAPCRACEIGDVLDAVEDFPAADVRPVVLCLDCKHKGWVQEPEHGKSVDYCRLIERCVDKQFFCAAGERKPTAG